MRVVITKKLCLTLERTHHKPGLTMLMKKRIILFMLRRLLVSSGQVKPRSRSKDTVMLT
jgi:hypothetical protein